MPRKPKKEKKFITVVVNGRTVGVTLFPPNGTHRSWYAYWSGLKSRRSTGQNEFEKAVEVVHDMLTNNGLKTLAKDAILSDDEFDEIQRKHYAKRKDPAKQERAKKSLINCMEAITAFRQISRLAPISIATPDDCERFQSAALELPKDWRVHYSDTSRSKRHRETRKTKEKLSPNTVVKWSIALQAAFERACKSGGNKCVRGVVPAAKLLVENPWRQFTWIEGRDPTIRQFDERQLNAILDYFGSSWPQVTTAVAAVKLFVWSYARRREVARLRWGMIRVVGGEVHFDVVGKWGVRKWFRIPSGLYQELLGLKADSDFVFARFSDELRQHHLSSPAPKFGAKVRQDFDPENFGDWLYKKISCWSKSLPNGRACLHMFRKTSLQYARSGEDVNRQVASDAHVTTGVMMTNYVQETDEELRQKSNRTFARIAASLSPESAKRFGHVMDENEVLKRQIQLAVMSENWQLVQQLTAELTKRKQDGE